MNLYEHEGKEIFAHHGIQIPRGVLISREMNSPEAITQAYASLAIPRVVVKAQILSGKRGKNNGIMFCSTQEEVEKACAQLFETSINGQYVASVLIEEMLDIAEEHYLSIVYDTASKQPLLLASTQGGMDIEDVEHDSIQNIALDIRVPQLSAVTIPYAQELWNCFREVDARVVEINPLVKTKSGEWFAADAKIALDDDAFFRHESWSTFASRTMMGRLPTEREEAVKKIDEGEAYYRGTAGKYIEMDGDIAILFSGGGASIANMDALIQEGLKPANYTEYSGNPPREKVAALAKIVLSKPGLKGLWIAGGVANFTNIEETFNGIVDALDEVKPTYPIVVRRAGPYEKEGMDLMRACALRNQLDMTLFGKETSMSESAQILATRVRAV